MAASGGAISAHLDRLKQLRAALDTCDAAMQKAESDNRYYDEQVGYIALRGQNPIADFRVRIDGAMEALGAWAKIKNKEDPSMTSLLRGSFDRLREGGAKFSDWMSEGSKRLETLKAANRG